jgi:hypothetical protein
MSHLYKTVMDQVTPTVILEKAARARTFGSDDTKSGKVVGIRFDTLSKICEVLNCQPPRSA